MSDAEEWRTVKEFPGYEVSSLGRYRNARSQQLLKPGRANSGYLQAKFSIGGKTICRYIHRLMWQAFVGPIPAGLNVNHLSAIKTDNRVENFELVTQAENVAHAQRLGLFPHGDHHYSRRDPSLVRRGEKQKHAKLNEEKVRYIRSQTARGRTHESIAKELGVSRRLVGRANEGSVWAHVR